LFPSRNRQTHVSALPGHAKIDSPADRRLYCQSQSPEQEITVEGTTRKLEEPFFVIGTQNPLDQSGTFPLPESQLDRFMMKIKLGYPDADAERALLAGGNPREKLGEISATTTPERFIEIQRAVDSTHCSQPLLHYVLDLIQATRNPGLFVYGISPRAGMSVVRASKAWALMNGRNHVEPGDVKAVFGSVAGHRLTLADQHSKSIESLIENLLEVTPIP